MHTGFASHRAVFIRDRPMSRKIPDFRHIIPNAFADLSEFGDAVTKKIPHLGFLGS
jgi:hypothetical protein